ncbi:MAG: ferritin family protein [Desulfatibacillaceae bacterium]
MDKSTLNALEIARIATDIEDSGIRFYSAAAEKAVDPEAKELFEKLSHAELDHMNRFRKMYARLDEEMGGMESSAEMLFDDELTSYLRALSDGAVFPDAESARQWVAEAPDMLSILRRALEAEKSSVLFYQEMADHNAFADSRGMLASIIAEEKSHAAWVSAMIYRLGQTS